MALDGFCEYLKREAMNLLDVIDTNTFQSVGYMYIVIIVVNNFCQVTKFFVNINKCQAILNY